MKHIGVSEFDIIPRWTTLVLVCVHEVRSVKVNTSEATPWSANSHNICHRNVTNCGWLPLLTHRDFWLGFRLCFLHDWLAIGLSELGPVEGCGTAGEVRTAGSFLINVAVESRRSGLRIPFSSSSGV